MIEASPLETLLLSFAKGSPRRGPGVIRKLSTSNWRPRGWARYVAWLLLKSLSPPVTMHPSASSLTPIEALTLATMRDHVVALAAKQGIAAVDCDTEVEERLARTAAATVLDISAICDDAM